MSIIKPKATSINGVTKNEFIQSLQHLSDQVRRIDQKLTMKVDNEILGTFYSIQKSIKQSEIEMERK